MMLEDSSQNFVNVSLAGELVPNTSMRANTLASHPVETIQQSRIQLEKRLERTALGNVYGSFLPMYMQTQEHILSQVGRAPHLPSSRIALETWTGEDEMIGFEDILGDEEMLPLHVEPHLALERKLGIQQPRLI